MAKESAAKWQDLSVVELEKRCREVVELIARARERLPGLEILLDDERAHKVRLRDGEDVALEATLRAAEVRPAAFESLGDRDGGRDPDAFEPGVLRDRLRVRSALATLNQSLAPFAQAVSDGVLTLGDSAREPIRLAYRIASGLRATDGKVREALKPATDYYGGIAAKGAKTKKAAKK